MSGTWDASVFDAIYRRGPDPWGFETSPYERAKYDATLRLLPPDRRFGDALELGCSIGVFSRRLAPRCDRLLAIDCAAAALARARDASAAHGNIRFEQAMLPGGYPADGAWDLVVISELLYFLSPTDVGVLASHVVRSLRPGGTVVLANWTGPTDTPCTGEEAATLFVAAAAVALTPRSTERAASYRLDLLQST